MNRKKLTVLSYGGGQDSFGILNLLFNDLRLRSKYVTGKLLVVMSATGDEHGYTYENIKRARAMCNSSHNTEFHHITPDMGYHRGSWPDLITPQLRGEGGEYAPTMVQSGTKSCTLQLKIDPIYKFLDEYINNEYGYGHKVHPGHNCKKRPLKSYFEEFGPLDVVIGFAAGEESRVRKAMALQNNPPRVWQGHVNRIFPLVELGIDRKQAQRHIRMSGEVVPPPSNCMRCPYMGLQEMLWLHREHPDKFEEWCLIEERKLERYKDQPDRFEIDKKSNIEYLQPFKNHGVYNSAKTLRDRLMEAETKFGDWTTEELFEFKFSHGCTKNGF